jgi:hypothetical protein
MDEWKESEIGRVLMPSVTRMHIFVRSMKSDSERLQPAPMPQPGDARERVMERPKEWVPWHVPFRHALDFRRRSEEFLKVSTLVGL